MDTSYHSDSSDDVYFGPYTMQEAKSDLRRLKKNLGAKTGTTPKRRHSAISSFNVPVHSTTSYLENLNISPGSDYVTCNEMSSIRSKSDDINQAIIDISDDDDEVEPHSHEQHQLSPIAPNIKQELDDYEEKLSIISIESSDDDENEREDSAEFGEECRTSTSNGSNEQNLNTSFSYDLKLSPCNSEASSISDIVHTNESGDNVEFSEECCTSPSNGSNDQSLNTSFSDLKLSPRNSKASSIPDIIVHSNYDDSVYFNDTLEEMNQFLKQGPDYVMPERKKLSPIPHISPVKERKLIHIARHNPFETTPVRKSKSAEKIVKPTVQDDRAKSVGATAKTSKQTKIPSLNVKNLFPEFKVPVKPSVKAKSSLKNVVSPVAVYIKNTPKYCPLMKNTKISQNLFNMTTKKSPIAVDTLSTVIPKVIYQPAKTKIQSTVTAVNLPNNIKKIITQGVVTKHEKRTGVDIGNETIERRLLESDLSLDLSQGPIQDVSVLTHKQPYNFKR